MIIFKCDKCGQEFKPSTDTTLMARNDLYEVNIRENVHLCYNCAHALCLQAREAIDALEINTRKYPESN